jgi:hypothetical protein
MIDVQFSDEPKVEEMFPWSKVSLRKKRMRNKFVNGGWHRYVPRPVRMQYLGKLMVLPIRRAMRMGGIGRQIFSVEKI